MVRVNVCPFGVTDFFKCEHAANVAIVILENPRRGVREEKVVTLRAEGIIIQCMTEIEEILMKIMTSGDHIPWNIKEDRTHQICMNV